MSPIGHSSATFCCTFAVAPPSKPCKPRNEPVISALLCMSTSTKLGAVKPIQLCRCAYEGVGRFLLTLSCLGTRWRPLPIMKVDGTFLEELDWGRRRTPRGYLRSARARRTEFTAAGLVSESFSCFKRDTIPRWPCSPLRYLRVWDWAIRAETSYCPAICCELCQCLYAQSVRWCADESDKLIKKFDLETRRRREKVL
ncbi:hypothetical protein BGW80DRAFT_576149 [Lactifluus volemus]|nr:hypothetical protein BGW80DRAFT_576149 [Lactifluus volemus]